MGRPPAEAPTSVCPDRCGGWSSISTGRFGSDPVEEAGHHLGGCLILTGSVVPRPQLQLRVHAGRKGHYALDDPQPLIGPPVPADPLQLADLGVPERPALLGSTQPGAVLAKPAHADP